MASPRYDIFKDPSFDRPGPDQSGPDQSGPEQTGRHDAYADEDDAVGEEGEGQVVARTIIYGDGRRRRIEAPKPGKRIDWGYAALLLAQGKSVEQAAQDLMCRPERIWRNMKRSRRFRARVELELDRQRVQTSIQFRNLAGHAIKQIERRTELLDAKTVLWLAERLRLGGRPRKADALEHWLKATAGIPGDEPPPPQPEPEKPMQVGSKEAFFKMLGLAGQLGSDKLTDAVVKAEIGRLDANHSLRKDFLAQQEAADKEVL